MREPGKVTMEGRDTPIVIANPAEVAELEIEVVTESGIEDEEPRLGTEMGGFSRNSCS